MLATEVEGFSGSKVWQASPCPAGGQNVNTRFEFPPYEPIVVLLESTVKDDEKIHRASYWRFGEFWFRFCRAARRLRGHRTLAIFQLSYNRRRSQILAFPGKMSYWFVLSATLPMRRPPCGIASIGFVDDSNVGQLSFGCRIRYPCRESYRELWRKLESIRSSMGLKLSNSRRGLRQGSRMRKSDGVFRLRRIRLRRNDCVHDQGLLRLATERSISP